MNSATLFAGILFGGIGLAAFLYGKKQAAWKPMVIGAALMAFPYFIPDVLAQTIIGVLLTLALFLFR